MRIDLLCFYEVRIALLLMILCSCLGFVDYPDHYLYISIGCVIGNSLVCIYTMCFDITAKKSV